MRQHAIKALLIDLDGTLVDSAPDLTAAMNRLLGESGQPARSTSFAMPSPIIEVTAATESAG